MSEKQFKLAICQIRTELEQEETMIKAEAMVREAAAAGARFVCLPEMFNCPYTRHYFKLYAKLGHEETVARMSGWAKENGVYLIGGSICELEDDKVYNTCFVFDPEGNVIAKHRKVHMFDIDLPTARFKESDTFSAGSSATTFDTEYGKMGVAICFDGRFPELFRAEALAGAKLIFLPAQFNMTTGPMHWDLMIRSRAVDNQVFFVAASCARYEGFKYLCWGHSSVIEPLGRKLAECDETEQILYCDIDLDLVDEARRGLPLLASLREDVYPLAR